MNDKMSFHNSKIFAQLCVLTEEYLDHRYVEKILEQGYDIDYQAPTDDYFTLRKPDLIGSTALHVAMGNKDIFAYLLENGADFTLKNAKGMTVLHEAVSRIYDDNWLQGRFESKLNNDYAKLVLDAHVRSNIRANPRDRNGISHLHVACMTNDARAVEFFLSDSGIFIGQSVNEDSPIFPGYGPLHIAVEFNCLEVVGVLLKSGVDVNSKDAKGRTAMEVAVERNMEIVDYEDSGACSDVHERENVIIKLLINEKFNGDHLSQLHVACTLSDISWVEEFLRLGHDIDEPVDATSPLWRGYTPLHFAAHFNVDAFKLLLQNGVDVDAKDARGTTPLDICEGKFRIKDLLFVISSHPIWRNIAMSGGGKIKLTGLLEAMQNVDGFSEFLDESMLDVDVFVPIDSTIWSGRTILNLAVTFTETFATEYDCHDVKRRRRESSTYLRRLEVCLKRGADVTIKDSHGRTPLTRAFRSNRLDAVELMLEYHWSTSNPIDVDNLSHLFVACYAENDRVVGKLLSNNADANPTINHGSTPLHAAVTRGSVKITSMLLEKGVDVNARDRDGSTAIHKSLCAYRDADRIFDLLVSSTDLQCGLNYLHIAVYFGDLDCVRRLIDMGVNVNATIECSDYSSSFVNRYSGCTALHVNLRKSRRRDDISELLIRSGADIFVRNSAGLNSFHESLRTNNEFIVSFVEKDSNLQKRMREDSGLTMLHIACWKLDVTLTRDRLSRGDDVNARVDFQSPIWPGWTPLHVLMAQFAVANDRVMEIIRLMMESGADCSLTNDELATPIHLIEDNGKTNSSIARLLLKNSRFNRVNIDGISHFHVACSQGDLVTMEKFLRAGVDVDEPANFLTAKYPGYVPIHFAVTAELSIDVVTLLLRYGADVDARDTCGNTAIHVAVKCGVISEGLLKILACAGADINSTNIFGETPLETLLKSNNVTTADIELFIEYGCHLNSFNPINNEGCISHILAYEYSCRVSAKTNLMLENILSRCDIEDIDAEGRTVIHNIVSTKKTWVDDYSGILKKLLMRGCNVDQQDAHGRTPLHMAVQFNNNEAVLGLLDAGADINIVDVNGNTPLVTCLNLFDECNEYAKQLLMKVLITHINKLQISGLHVSEVNNKIAMSSMKECFIDKNTILLLKREIEMSKYVMAGSSVTLYNFISETGAVASYPIMTYAERNLVDVFFRHDKSNFIFRELNSLLKLQYKKALKRQFLNRLGTEALNAISNFSFPELCSRAVLRCLTNEQLENLIVASTSDFRFSSFENRR